MIVYSCLFGHPPPSLLSPPSFQELQIVDHYFFTFLHRSWRLKKTGNHLEQPKTNLNFQNPTGEVTEDGVSKRFRLPHEFKGRPGSTPEVHYDPSEPLNLPEVGSGSKRLQGADESTVQPTHSPPHLPPS
jgi:hypothetical protein